MKTILVLLITFYSSVCFSQENNDSLINITIDNFFDGLNTHDTMKVKSAVWADVFEMKSLSISPNESYTMWEEETLSKFLNILGTPREELWEERILSRTIHQNGHIAVAWLPYEFYFDGKYSHEGVNLIQFAKEEGKWVMISIVDTRKRVKQTGE